MVLTGDLAVQRPARGEAQVPPAPEWCVASRPCRHCKVRCFRAEGQELDRNGPKVR